jgi:hypothetical protein
MLHTLELMILLADDRRNATGLAEVIKLSRSYMSATAKAKTAKLSTFFELGD